MRPKRTAATINGNCIGFHASQGEGKLLKLKRQPLKHEPQKTYSSLKRMEKGSDGRCFKVIPATDVHPTLGRANIVVSMFFSIIPTETQYIPYYNIAVSIFFSIIQALSPKP